MKNPMTSLWLTTANRAAGWWMGHAAALTRRQQRATFNELTKVALGAKPKPKRRAKKKRRVP